MYSEMEPFTLKQYVWASVRLQLEGTLKTKFTARKVVINDPKWWPLHVVVVHFSTKGKRIFASVHSCRTSTLHCIIKPKKHCHRAGWRGILKRCLQKGKLLALSLPDCVATNFYFRSLIYKLNKLFYSNFAALHRHTQLFPTRRFVEIVFI